MLAVVSLPGELAEGGAEAWLPPSGHIADCGFVAGLPPVARLPGLLRYQFRSGPGAVLRCATAGQSHGFSSLWGC